LAPSPDPVVAIPLPTSATVEAIYRAYEAANENWDSWGLSVGELGNECDRMLWYGLHWASPAEDVDGRKVSIFRTGDRWESVLVEDLEQVGIRVYDQQARIRLVGNHVRGKCDGKAMGVLEAPRTEHLLEFKSSNEANFNAIKKKGVKAAKPAHYAQCQLGMHAFGLTRALYLIVNKNTDERHVERIHYDFEYCVRLLARAERIIVSGSPPPRITDKPDAFVCKFCRHQPLCHQPEETWARVNCRTCIFSEPTMEGDAVWTCARFNKPLSIDEQRAGCGAHLWNPGLVPGEQTDSSEEEEWIQYKLAFGEVFVDGKSEKRSCA